MNKVILTLTLTLTLGTSVSPALGWQLCLNPNSKTYNFLGAVSDAAERLHGGPMHSWKQIPESAVEELMIHLVKQGLAGRAHIPVCAASIAPHQKLSREDIEALLAALGKQ